MKADLTKQFVATAMLPEGKDRALWWDTKLTGFGLLMTKGGHKGFVVRHRAGGAERRMHLDVNLTVEAARTQAKAIIGKVAAGKALGQAVDPLQERRRERAKDGNALKTVATVYLAEQAKRLRTIEQRMDDFERLIYPKLGHRQVEEIGRRDIARLLDEIARDHGPVMADRILAVLRHFLNWHAARSDDYRSPIVRGMARTRPHERKRKRILNDDEIRAIWKAAEVTEGPFGVYVRFTFLTACRRNESARLPWAEMETVKSEPEKRWIRWPRRHVCSLDAPCGACEAQGECRSAPQQERIGPAH
jgi:Arm DNA-binding domain